MSLKEFDILEKIGDGAYSVVSKVRRKSDGAYYALKKVKFQPLKEKEKENALTEVRIMASINHPNVIGYKEAFIDETNNSLCIVMEFADDGDLLQKINAHKRKATFFTEKQIWDLFIQTIRGLKALHDLKILHRDIKSANVLLSRDGSIKLSDMNVSKVAKRGLVYTQTGTPYYASPEVWRDRPYDSKSDIWSLGCVLYEAITLNPPFTSHSMKGLYQKVIKCDYTPIPPSYSSDLRNLIRLMLQLDSSKRPSCSQLLGMDFIKKRARTVEPAQVPGNLIGTIRVPSNIRSLSNKLPAPAYDRSYFSVPASKRNSNYQSREALSNFESNKSSPNKGKKLQDIFRPPGEGLKSPLRSHELDRLRKRQILPAANLPPINQGSSNQSGLASRIQSLKRRFEKPSFAPSQQSRVSVRPSWWG